MADMIDVLLAYHKGGGGSGSSYDDTELRSKIANLQTQVDACGDDIDAIQATLEAHADTIAELQTTLGTQATSLADLAKRLADAETAVTGLQAATTQNTTNIASNTNRIAVLEAAECDCIQHSILNGNWLDEEEELTTWDLFINYCKEHFTKDDLVGYQVTDDGDAAYKYNVVDISTLTNPETGVAYDCLILQNATPIKDIPYDPKETTPNDVSSSDVITSGYADWSLSFVRQYLNNATAEFTTTHTGDVLPTTLPTVTYLQGLSADLKNHMMQVEVTQNEHTTQDYVTLPSVTQMNGVASPAIGTVLTYWKNMTGSATATNSELTGRICKNSAGIATTIALLDMESGNKGKRAYIRSTGAIGYSSPYNTTAIMPLIYLPVKEAESND